MSVFHYIKYVGDKGYVVKREMPVHNFVRDGDVRMDWLKAFRDYLNCDHVLQTDKMFLFCETIQDAEILNGDNS